MVVTQRRAVSNGDVIDAGTKEKFATKHRVLSKSENDASTEYCATNKNNMFRSNQDFIEQPRQIISLIVMVTVAGLIGFKQDDADRDTSTRAALAGVSFLFLLHCFLQCRDTHFVRPHPGFWRVVHGLGMLYLMGVSVMLFHTRADARRLLTIVFDDIKSNSATLHDQHVQDYDDSNGISKMDCTLTIYAVLNQLREIWFIAHVAGWWGKMCLFRDWHVCWTLSLGFEVVELSMGWLVPQFKECWWDSVFVDFFGANLIGMTLGLITLRFLENKSYDWKGAEKGTRRKFISFAAKRFSPFSWKKWEWGTFSSFKRFCQILLLIIVVLATELNAFMMLNALDVPKTSVYNAARLTVLFLVGLPGAGEYYEYITNKKCMRLGQNAWLILAILQVETLTWVKFLPQSLLEAEYPAEVKLPLSASACLLALWTLLFYITHKRSDDGKSQIDLDNWTRIGSDNKPNRAKIGLFRNAFLRRLLDILLMLSLLPLAYLAKQYHM